MGKERVASVNDIPAGEPLQVEVGGTKMALVRVEDEVFCVQDVCSHEEAYLSEGFCERYEIECPLHGSIFDVRTGEVKSLPATENIKTFPVSLEGDDVFVEVSR